MIEDGIGSGGVNTVVRPKGPHRMGNTLIRTAPRPRARAMVSPRETTMTES